MIEEPNLLGGKKPQLDRSHYHQAKNCLQKAAITIIQNNVNVYPPVKDTNEPSIKYRLRKKIYNQEIIEIQDDGQKQMVEESKSQQNTNNIGTLALNSLNQYQFVESKLKELNQNEKNAIYLKYRNKKHDDRRRRAMYKILSMRKKEWVGLTQQELKYKIKQLSVVMEPPPQRNAPSRIIPTRPPVNMLTRNTIKPNQDLSIKPVTITNKIQRLDIYQKRKIKKILNKIQKESQPKPIKQKTYMEFDDSQEFIDSVTSEFDQDQDEIFSPNGHMKSSTSFSQKKLVNTLPKRNVSYHSSPVLVSHESVSFSENIKNNEMYYISNMFIYSRKNKNQKQEINIQQIKERIEPSVSHQMEKYLHESNRLIQACKNIAIPLESSITKLKLRRNLALNHKKTLVLDLDETLIHSQSPFEKVNPKEFPYRIEFEASTRRYAIRNYARQFLENLSTHYYIVLFTSAVQGYADLILEKLDPHQKFIRHRLYRHHCYCKSYGSPFIKDLRILNRDLSQMVLVDNSIYTYWFQMGNGVPILPFEGFQDDELKKLEQYLLKIESVDDVREINRRVFAMETYGWKNVNDLVNQYRERIAREIVRE